MKVAVSSTGRELDSEIDPRFGRCAFFLIVDTEDMSFEVIPNGGPGMRGGAGIAAAQLVASKGARAVITGSCGPNAVQALTAGGLQLYLGQTGKAREAVEKLRNGRLTPSDRPNVPPHSGMGRGGGRGGFGSRFGGRGNGGVS
ncbi:MAG: NifB/NifX family molybdenum-iron cluster-binding protein [Deltaproteobacteria bacterium]|nr:NifB/NifX family molybdenum-iron cluster-binding protein [Deltaproteobacteria bacterium]MBW2015508.1 NifB/NifX family molybdenum-iron cluster-binding protein [Deltaproteobacteria bacterium]MBW2128743.1 NifB/NifX family molybdenum-iron cluster-binding protein [Deltaproteobacteria bacterium]MBW2303929.1 NifB/NifX family molybdenum-iron cluster-binding protein [Deltaproteobacteria bacterium]